MPDRASSAASSNWARWRRRPELWLLLVIVLVGGLFGALAVISIRTRRDLRPIGGLLVINLIITFWFPNLSWQGHLGGLAGGALVTAILVYAPRGSRRALVQWLALAGVAALIALAVIARSAALA